MSSPSGHADKTLTPAQVGAAFQQAAALHGQGRLAEAWAIYEDIVRKQPRHFDALHGLGVIAYQARDYQKALGLIAAAIKIYPDSATFHSNYGLVLLDMGDVLEALNAFERATKLGPNFASAFSNRGNALHILGRYPEALTSCERAVGLAPNDAGAHYNRAQTLHALGRQTEALASYDQTIALAPDYADAHVNRGNVLQELDRREDAIAAYDRAIALDKTMAPAYANRGMVRKSLARFDEALADFDHALSLDGSQAFIYSARGAVHKQRGDLDNALADFAHAVKLEPDNFEARKNFFWIHLWRGEDSRDVDRLSAELAQMKADLDVDALKSSRRIQGFRLLHDLEQAEYLARDHGGLDGLADAQAVLSTIKERTSADVVEAVSDADVETLGRFRRTVLRHTPPPPVVAVNPANNWSAIEDRYLGVKPEIVVIDNFLTPEALKQLREFCLASTVWRTDYSNAYLGAFPEDGFISPLHLQIAAELRRVMPRVIGDHTLEQMWAFKYTSRSGKGISIHADFARVNLNFWITPDDANLDPTSGGMEIYDVPAPRDWTFHDYNGASPDKIFTFLKGANAGSRTIPYKCNRAVLFNSNLFHKTSEIRFKDGYENRRMNVTYLFGVGLGFP